MMSTEEYDLNNRRSIIEEFINSLPLDDSELEEYYIQEIQNVFGG